MAVSFRRPYPAYRVNAYQASADQPMSEMNTTPLIDVLLVLLIMIIMTVPLGTHVLDVDLPGEAPVTPGEARQFSITISPAGQVFWDGEAVNQEGLGDRLAQAAALSPEPVIRFQPDPQTSYDASVQVIAQVRDAGLKKFAFIGNHEFRSFGRD
jgi:biopolymer transport protein ExbD